MKGLKKGSAGALDSPRSRARARADEERRAAVAGATLEKLLKSRLSVAAEHFNRDHKKAFLYLKVRAYQSSVQDFPLLILTQHMHIFWTARDL